MGKNKNKKKSQVQKNYQDKTNDSEIQIIEEGNILHQPNNEDNNTPSIVSKSLSFIFGFFSKNSTPTSTSRNSNNISRQQSQADYAQHSRIVPAKIQEQRIIKLKPSSKSNTNVISTVYEEKQVNLENREEQQIKIEPKKIELIQENKIRTNQPIHFQLNGINIRSNEIQLQQQMNLKKLSKQLKGKNIIKTHENKLIIIIEQLNQKNKIENIYLSEQTFFSSRCSKIKLFIPEKQVLIHYKDIHKKVPISKSMTKQQILLYLQQQLCLPQQFPQVILQIQLKSGKIKQIISLTQRILDQKQTTQIIYINRLMKIKVIYEQRKQTFQIQQNKTCIQLKKQISKKFSVPQDSQCLKYQQFVNQVKTILSLSDEQNFFKFDKTQIMLELNRQIDLQYYGFNKNYQISFQQQFKQFFVETQDQYEGLLTTINEDLIKQQSNQKLFFKKAIKFFISALKKQFDLDYVIDKISSRIYDRYGITIWRRKSQKFNKTFITHYILQNCKTHELQRAFINSIKFTSPLPIMTHKFTNINMITPKSLTKTTELSWFSNDYCNFVNVGFHKQKKYGNHAYNHVQQGKTFLLNFIAKTQFQLKDRRHPITVGCPEVYLSYFNQKFPLNIIDIPNSLQENFKEQIIQIADFVLIHSWKNREQTLDQIKKYKISNYMVIYRDCNPNEADNLILRKNKFKQQQNPTPIKQLNILKIQKNNNQFLNPLSFLIWNSCRLCLTNQNSKQQLIFANKKSKSSKSLINFLNSKNLNSFQEILKQIRQKMCSIYSITPRMEKIKLLQKKFQEANQVQISQIKAKIKQQGLNKLLEKTISFICGKKNSQCYLLRLKQFLKAQKQIYIHKAEIFNKIKIQLEKLQKDISIQKLDVYYQKFIEIEKQFPQIKKLKSNKKSLQECIDFIKIYEESFGVDVKPKILTIEMIWRQLQYLYMIDPSVKINGTNLLNAITNLKKTQINNFQPFQILDGDLLEIPQTIMKSLFLQQKQKVFVISVFGPQSSGKSTLLNYLFGCDFGVSAGRCTRGAYGTFFKFSNKYPNNAQGIFVIDTEGLFGIYSKNEDSSTLRHELDSKIVLFCMSISNLIIVNVKGNIDEGTNKILKSSYQRLQTLKKGAILPKCILVLNQNVTNEINTSKDQIHKLGFDRNLTVSLQLAYDLITINFQTCGILQKDEQVIKKKAKQKFLIKCLEIIEKIFNCILQTKQFIQLSALISQMQLFWNTIDIYPHLGTNKSKKINNLEKQLKQWMDQKRLLVTNKKEILKKQKTSCQQAQKQLKNYILQIINQYQEKITTKNRQIQQVDKINQFKLKIKISLFNILKEFQYENISHNINKALKSQQNECKKQLKSLIRLVKIQQAQLKSKQMSEEDKKLRFQKFYQQMILGVQKKIILSESLSQKYKQIFQYYENHLKSQKNQYQLKFEVGLPEYKKLQDISEFILTQEKLNQDVEMIQNKLFNQKQNLWAFNFDKDKSIELKKGQILAQKTVGKQSSKFFLAQLRYFKMGDYFTQRDEERYISIQQKFLAKYLKQNKIKLTFQNQIRKLKSFQYLVQQIKNLINKFLWYQQCDFYMSEETHDFYSTLFQNIYQINKNCSLKYIKFSLNKKQNYSPLNQQQLKFIKKFINIELFSLQYQQYLNEIKRYNLYYHNYYFSKYKRYYIPEFIWSNFTKILSIYILKWDQIRRFIQADSNFNENINQINKKMTKQLNEDFKIFNCQMMQLNLYKILFPNHNQILNNTCQTIQDAIQITTNNQSPRQQNNIKDLYQRVRKLKFIDGYELQNHICFSKENLNAFAYYITTIFDVKKKYQSNVYLKTYLQSDSRQLYKALAHLKEFVFQQLRKNQKFQLLFSDVHQKVKQQFKSMVGFSRKNIEIICKKVTDLITDFNNDLNQVGYKITVMLTGIIHLYAVYVAWVYQASKVKKQLYLPIETIKANKQKYYQQFLSGTSTDEGKKSEGEVQSIIQILQKVIAQKIKQKKQSGLNQNIKRFKQENKRKEVQKKLEKQYFSEDKTQDQIIDFINNQHIYLENFFKQQASRYEQKMNKDWTQETCIQAFENPINQLFKIFQTMLIELKISNLKVIQKFQKRQNESNQTLELQMGKYTLRYIFNLILGKEVKKFEHQHFLIMSGQVFKSDKFKFSISEQLKSIFALVIAQCYQQNETITNLRIFLNYITEQKYIKQIKQLIRKELQLNKKQKQFFQTNVAVSICNRQCPGCKKICGIQQGSHLSNHRCIYGHQFRVLGKVRMKNNDPSFSTCEQLEQWSPIQFMNQKYSWLTFKQHWKKDREDKWDLQIDTKLSQEQKQQRITEEKQKMKIIWKIAGQEICNLYGMNYIEFTDENINKKSLKKSSPIHYIFVVDESGSMKNSINANAHDIIIAMLLGAKPETIKQALSNHNSSSRWQDLMNALKGALEKIKNDQFQRTNCLISILKEGNNCTIHQQSKKVEQINLDSITPEFDQNNFQDTFKTVAAMITSILQNGSHLIKFVFMTDGNWHYPAQQVQKIKQLQQDNPERIFYYGIEFNKQTTDTMKQIRQELKGQYKLCTDAIQLQDAYIEVIEDQV